MCMKRTNLVLNEELLKQVIQIFGVKTYSAAVNQSLEQTIRMNRAKNITQFFGQGVWEGNLAEMREDRPHDQVKRRRRALKKHSKQK